MDVDIYQSITKPGKFVAIPSGLAPSAIPFPDADLANLATFKVGHRFNPEKHYNGADVADISRQLDRNGFAIFFAGEAT